MYVTKRYMLLFICLMKMGQNNYHMYNLNFIYIYILFKMILTFSNIPKYER